MVSLSVKGPDEGHRNLARFYIVLTVISLSVAAISCQPSAGHRLTPSAGSPTPEVTEMRMVEEIIEKVETEEGVEIRRTVREYVVTLALPLDEAVKIQKVETDDQIEIVKIDITPGGGACLQVVEPGSTPPPPHMCFSILVTSRNKGPARTIRTRITIEDPSTGKKHTTGFDEFVDSGGTISPPLLGFHVEQKRWVAHVEVRVIR